LATWATDVCSRAARQLIGLPVCIEPTGLRLRHTGKTDPQCGTVQFCFHSGRLTCSARTGFRAVTTPLYDTIRDAVLTCAQKLKALPGPPDETENTTHALLSPAWVMEARIAIYL